MVARRKRKSKKAVTQSTGKYVVTLIWPQMPSPVLSSKAAAEKYKKMWSNKIPSKTGRRFVIKKVG